MTGTNLPPAAAKAVRDALRKGGAEWIARLYRHEILKARTVRGMQIEASQAWNRIVVQPLLRAIAGHLATLEVRGQDILFEALPQLRAIEADIAATVGRGSDALRRLTSERLYDLVRQEADWLAANAKRSLSVKSELPESAVQKAVEAPILGEKVEGWFAKTLATPTANNTRRFIVTALERGLTTDEIVRGLRGTRENNYRDGVIGGQSLRDVQALVQSAAAASSARIRFESFKALGVAKWRWLATLDTKTCIICGQNESGSPYDVGEGPTFPAHPRCRCSPAPWMGEPIGERASTDGPVPAETTFGEWLEGRSVAEQDEVLGRTRAEAWRSGNLTLRDMLGNDLQPLTIDELRRLDRIPDDEE